MTYRKLALPLILYFCAALSYGGLAILAGCAAQNITAASLSIIGNSYASVLTAQGKTAEAANITKLTNAAATTIKGFVPGTSPQAVTTDLLLLANAIKATATPDIQPYIDAAISDIQAIELLYPDTEPGTLSPALVVQQATTPVTPDEYKAKFNALVATHPIKGLKPLK